MGKRAGTKRDQQPRQKKAKLSKTQLFDDLLQQVRNGIDEALLIHAPEHWRDEDCDSIEKQALESTRRVLAEFGVRELKSIRALPALRAIAAAQTMRLIEQIEAA